MFFSGQITNVLSEDDVLSIQFLVNDIKSSLYFFTFFLVIYVIGKCILSTLKYFWELIILSVGLYLIFTSTGKSNLIETIQELTESIYESIQEVTKSFNAEQTWQ